MIPVLTTKRLIMRGFVDADLDAYAAIVGDPEVMRYIGAGKPLSRAEAWRSMALHLGHWALRGYGKWALVDQGSGRLVGLFNPDGWPGLEAGWVIARAHWGRGFGTEAGRAAIDYAFETLGADKVISVIAPANAASIRVAEKLGERYETTAEIDGITAAIYGSGDR